MDFTQYKTFEYYGWIEESDRILNNLDRAEFEARGLKLVEEGGGHSTTTYSESDYVEGTLVCDIYDKAKEQLVWEGIGTGTINQNPKNRDQSIPEAVKLIMAKYPVAPITE